MQSFAVMFINVIVWKKKHEQQKNGSKSFCFGMLFLVYSIRKWNEIKVLYSKIYIVGKVSVQRPKTHQEPNENEYTILCDWISKNGWGETGWKSRQVKEGGRWWEDGLKVRHGQSHRQTYTKWKRTKAHSKHNCLQDSVWPFVHKSVSL